MTELPSNSFHNYVVLCGNVQDIQQRTSKIGDSVSTARGLLATGFSGVPLPVQIVAVNGTSSNLKEGNQVLIGQLAYEENSANSQLLSQLILFVQRIEPYPRDSKLRNLAYLTLRLGDNVVPRMSQKGRMWVQVRAVLPQGKNENGAYKPSLWLNLKAFPLADKDPGVVYALAQFGKGDLVNVSGKIQYEVYQGKGSLSMIATQVEPFNI